MNDNERQWLLEIKETQTQFRSEVRVRFFLVTMMLGFVLGILTARWFH